MCSGIEVMNPTPVDWRNDRTRVELPHGQPDGQDPQVARTREEVLAGGTRLFDNLRTYLSGWKIPPSSSAGVTDLSDRIAERSPRAARQESPRLGSIWFHARARIPKTDLTRKFVWLPGTH